MGKNAPKPYRRLDKADRIAIERGLDKRKPCRQMARELGRSPSTIADEVARNRTVCRGPNKGGRAANAPEDACPKLLEWPRCCNGCRFRRYHCSRKWRCEYSAARAQALADAELRESRMGVDRGEAEFERAMGLIRTDVARGLSPEQIALARAAEVGASASTIYRWIERGYAGMSSLELRRKCGYKPRSRAEPPTQTAHGAARSFAAFMGLPEEERAADCEGIERSALDPAARRCSVFYCDARQSQQKGGCERNHVELRKILPKGRGISFDRLGGRDCAVLMSQLNSEPRPSLGGMCAIDMLLAALGADGRELLGALGVEKVAYEELDMTVGAIDAARRGRGEGPLVP